MNKENVEKRNLLSYTTEVISKLELNVDECVSTSFIFRVGADKKKIRGLNIQFYGHVLVIVPDIRNLNSSFKYISHVENVEDNVTKKNIIIDLQKNGFTQVDVAKMMKCSQSTINHILRDTD